MPTDAEKWDARYRTEKHPAGAEPVTFLQELLPMLPRGRALDLAMGAGRNAVFLAANGWHVTGVDCSPVALEKAAALAQQHGIAVHSARGFHELAPRLAGLCLLEADLERCPLPASRFDLVVCFYYLQRSLFPGIERTLRPGGMLVYETYTLDQLGFADGPRNPEHLLRPNELREAFPSLELIFYRELRTGKGIASLFARKPK